MDRRRILKAGAAALGLVPLLRLPRVARAAPRTRPRFYMQIVLDGGMDAVLSTDAKTTKDVDLGIDIPYAAKDIVEANGARLGPPLKPLARWMPQLAIVNGVRQNSANHVSGMIHTLRCSSRAGLDSPTLLDILGTRRHDEAAGSVSIGATQPTAFSPKFLGQPATMIFGKNPGFFDHLDQTSKEDLVALSKALRRDVSHQVKPNASLVQRTTGDNALEMADFFARVAEVPRFVAEDWGTHGDFESIPIQRALWLFENRLARCVTVTIGQQSFDSHYFNTPFQTYTLGQAAIMLDKLFTELQRRTVDGAPLATQIAIVMSSEIGRFPRMNHGEGKDHFPQAPYLVFGPAFATAATYGATGRDMAGVPISVTTGRPQRDGHLLRVDDVGTTLLALDGADPELYGYVGQNLRFLTG